MEQKTWRIIGNTIINIASLGEHWALDPLVKVMPLLNKVSLSFKAHMVTHTGERVFQGYVVDKSFTHASNKTTNFVTHTGESAIQCRLCDKSFARAASLKTHLVTHSGESYPVPSL